MFTEKDRIQFLQRGITPEKIEEQINCFRKGFPFISLHSAATAGNGIRKLDEQELHACIDYYEKHHQGKTIVKFVPASGAATRMFRDLLAFLADETDYLPGETAILAGKHPEILRFVENLYKFPFIRNLKQICLRHHEDLDILVRQENYRKIVALLVGSEGLNYGQLPKGVLKFHSYENTGRTALEEHMVEGAHYAVDDRKQVKLHVTVSEQFRQVFAQLADSMKNLYEEKYSVKFEISFSVQDPSTDTVAVDPANNPFREADGSIHFRPGGHGALLKNLNNLEADIIFIKNIDNVATDRLKAISCLYKKVLGGILLNLQDRISGFLHTLSGTPGPADLDEIMSFIKTEMQQDPGQGSLFDFLNRPVRVCGMVRNEGEPGGGPYWVNDSAGGRSLQIVEMSQVNTHDPRQMDIIRQSTHFNPVDLVCGRMDYRGDKFDLFRYVDPQTGFISEKSRDGRPLKALELPGLWNGAMAGWITVFVELPLETFTPVKTINDLLRDEHQSKTTTPAVRQGLLLHIRNVSFKHCRLVWL
jgi:hypothetical protein